MIHFEGKQIVIRDWKLKDAEDYIFWRQPGQPWQKFDGPIIHGCLKTRSLSLSKRYAQK